MHTKFSLKMNKINVAIVGNPNSGKSTLFSTLTGFHQEVGNWPGKTIEKKEGCTCFRNQKINFVDLPGIYSLNTDTQEEKIAKKFIESKKYDVILNIVDASNIERNLFLTMQLAMYTNNMIIVLNLNKYAKKIGYDIDIDKLSNKLGIPIVPMEAIDDIKKNILLLKIFNHKKKLIKPKKNKLKAEEIFNQIENILKSCIKKKDKNIFSNKLDKYLTDNYFGMFIFFVVMFFIFFLTFYLSEPIVKLLEKSIFILSNIIGSILIKISAPDFFISLINNGIISGIDLIQQIVEIFKKQNIRSEVLAASLRSPRHMREAAVVGADIATLPFDAIQHLLTHYKSQEGMKSFTKDIVPEYTNLTKK